MIADDIELARRLYQFVGEHELLEQGSLALSIATFRFVPEELQRRAHGDKAVTDYRNELNARICTASRRGGRAFVSNAQLEGRNMLRARIVNFRTPLSQM